jgi:hypothetical protein
MEHQSLPLDFSKMNVDEARHALKIIKNMLNTRVEEAKARGDRKLLTLQDNAKNITVPLKFLAKVFGVHYSVSIEIEKINVAIKEIEEDLDALNSFGKIFFAKPHAVPEEKQKVSGIGAWEAP